MTEPWWAPPHTSAVDVSIVIPAFNEAGRIGPTLRDLSTHLEASGDRHEIVVVDDGSSDETVAVVEREGRSLPAIRIVSLDRNRGKGHAVRVGVLESSGALVGFVDADGATPVGELDRLRAAIGDGAGVAIGSRVGTAAGVERDTKLHRRIMGRVFHGFVDAMVPTGVRDTQCGFKLFTRPVAEGVFTRVRSDGFGFDVEVLGLAARAGVPIVELPVSWTDVPTSRVRLVRDSVQMVRDVVAIRGRLRREPWSGPA